jgi:hypothetical protein
MGLDAQQSRAPAFYHFRRYKIICATAVHYDLAYPVFGFASSLKQTISLGWVLWLLLRFQENFLHHQRSFTLSVLYLKISSLSFVNVSFTTIFLPIWKLIGFMSIFSIEKAFHFTSSASSSSSGSRKSIYISILPPL